VARGLARHVLPCAVPARSRASTRFSYFETDGEFVIVSGIQV
jgi:hypothetical protein